jgi:hypothetical protein
MKKTMKKENRVKENKVNGTEITDAEIKKVLEIVKSVGIDTISCPVCKGGDVGFDIQKAEYDCACGHVWKKVRDTSESLARRGIGLKLREQSECDMCQGYGFWATGDEVPMGPMDAEDGCPSKKCPKCGAGGRR